MDKETFSTYGWILVATLIMGVMLAFASPFSRMVMNNVNDTVNDYVGKAFEEPEEAEEDMTYYYTGYIFDKNGDPISGATVTATSANYGDTVSVTSNYKGRFSLHFPRVDGAVTLNVQYDGASDDITLTVNANYIDLEITLDEIILVQTYTVSGMVTDAEGTPVANAVVKFYEVDTEKVVYTVATDATGTYNTVCNAGAYAVKVKIADVTYDLGNYDIQSDVTIDFQND